MSASCISQLNAVLWKAWRSRVNHYFVTAYNILLPVLFTFLLVEYNRQSTDSKIENETIFPPLPKNQIFNKSHGSGYDILFAPNTTEVFNLMSSVRTKLKELSIDNFRPMKNESVMERWFYDNSKSVDFKWNIGYGVVFNSIENGNLTYTIRNNKFGVWNTNLKFPIIQSPGPMNEGSVYIDKGFIALQIAVDEAFMEINGVKPLADWNIQEFPYPEYKRVNNFAYLYQELLPFLLCYGFLYTILSLIKGIGEEKESGIRERIRMSGVDPWITYIGWVIDYGLLALIASIVNALLLNVYAVSNDVPLFSKSSIVLLCITIWFYYLSGIFYAIAIANLFAKPKYSATCGVFFWTVSYAYFSFVLTKSPSALTLFLICMTPNGFLLSSIGTIARLEVLGIGITFSNLFSNQSHSDSVTIALAYTWIAAVFSMLIIFALILYLDAVLPGQYGIPKRFYYIFPKVFYRWICRVGPGRDMTTIENESDEVERNLSSEYKQKDSKITFEPLLGSLPIGIKIRYISKRFGTVNAINNFSIDIYKNEITALLGHNGAGKTTLLSIITGMLPPSDGSVQTEEYDVFYNLEKFRSDLGYCPQSNLLLPSLTVAEHVIFFAMIKGFSRKRAITHAEGIISKCRLTEKRNTKVSALSGGMRRKLCLAISLVNDPRILILDEPTSGLDPESRRAIWNILLELRSGRTVLLTTHFMEEADVLGDRIAIMSHGELKCYGTSLFLKKNYGSGYQVTVLLSQGTQQENVKKIIELVKQEVAESSMINESQESICFQLPLASVQQFPTLFKKLEDSKDLGVRNLAVSCTTIDDVFQKVNEEEGVKFEVDEVDLPLNYNQPSNFNGNSFSFSLTIALYWQRFTAILEKKLVWIYRNWIVTLLYVALPLLFAVMATSKSTSPATQEFLQPLRLDLQLYDDSDVVLATNDYSPNYAKSFNNEVLNQNSHIIHTVPPNSIIDQLLELARKDEARYRSSMIVAANLSDKSPTVLYSSIAIHSIPIAVNLFSNAILNAAASDGQSANSSITTYNYPYIFDADFCSIGPMELGNNIAYSIVIVINLTLIISFFMIHVHTERKTLFKELQILTGLRFYNYWIFTFIVDFMIYMLMALLLIGIILIFDSSSMLFYWNIVGSFTLVFALYGLSCIWCAYFFSYFFNTYNGSSLFFICFIPGLCIFGIIMVNVIVPDSKFLLYLFYLNPIQPFASATFNIVSEAKFNLMCKICKTPTIDQICAAKQISDDFDINLQLQFLSLDWLLYFGLIILIDCGFISFLWHRICSLYIGEIPKFSSTLDPDVIQEKSKVEKFSQNSGEENIVLITKGLAKKYSRKVTAVRDLSFGVIQGQCFGLLGTNGAGKSTTFEMLTAYIRPTKGDTSINGYSLSNNKSQYKLQFGYCPQSNALLGDLTGRETLKLFANLHGIPKNEVDSFVNKWINLLDLTEYQNRPSSTYSGGNQRKLSTAIALIGNPSVVFLDEPTTGVDPVTRRKIWQVLKMVQANNRTIIITSHSMDECEALCDRLTIMVKGTMQCIGNIQYLKKVFGKGYTALIKLSTTISNDQLNYIKERISALFADSATLRDEHKGLLHYHIKDATCPWSELFKNMSELKNEFEVIEDYILTDTSLEQVFLSFAASE
ncbi:hypothetical protein O3M35_004538 [Rhynocoris fuscipes]|uniref:ABC transporter domain-containing protein n=1 Tax=Rhynocoris fuscipes TaxID=488301 RepID=A0AAW1CIH3_9HEMI